MKQQLIYILLACLPVGSMAQQQLTLQQVKERALAHNISIRTANNTVEQAREQKKEAYTNYFPQVSATGGGFKSTRDILKADVKTSKLLPSSLAAALPENIAGMLPASLPVSLVGKGIIGGITAVQPVYAGGQIVNGNRLAKVGIEVGELQRNVAENTVELTAEQYYWQIVSLKEKQKTIDAVGAMLQKIEKDADLAVKAGVGLRNDLLQVQLKQNELESNRLKLDNGLKLARMVLAQYIGMDGEVDVTVAADPGQLPAYPMVKVDHGAAVASTSEYQLLQKNVEASTLQRKIEQGRLQPSVGVGIGYNYYNMGSGLENNFGAVFATVSVPISQWWGGSHAVRRRRLAEANARQQLEDNAELLQIRMQKNWNDVDNAYKQLVLAKKAIEQSEENLRLNRDYYQAGTTTMNNLLDAQQQYQQCRDRYTEAYAALQTKILEYEQSVGK